MCVRQSHTSLVYASFFIPSIPSCELSLSSTVRSERCSADKRKTGACKRQAEDQRGRMAEEAGTEYNNEMEN